jgi:hypothetical protein
MKKEEINFARNEKFNRTMIPGKFTIFMRNFVVWQALKFIIINIKMISVSNKNN